MNILNLIAFSLQCLSIPFLLWVIYKVIGFKRYNNAAMELMEASSKYSIKLMNYEINCPEKEAYEELDRKFNALEPTGFFKLNPSYKK